LPLERAVGVENLDESWAPSFELIRGLGAYAESGASLESFAGSA
jgi:hypothetical protein